VWCSAELNKNHDWSNAAKSLVFTVPLTAMLLLLALGEGMAKSPTPQPWSGPRTSSRMRPWRSAGDRSARRDHVAGANKRGRLRRLQLQPGACRHVRGRGCKLRVHLVQRLRLLRHRRGKGAPSPLQKHLGVVVLDASDPQHPEATAYLDDAALLEPWESLRVNAKRKLLGGTRGLGLDPVARSLFRFLRYLQLRPSSPAFRRRCG